MAGVKNENNLECPVCLETYNIEIRLPKLLPCLHSICKACLAKITTSTTVICPICRTAASIRNIQDNRYIIAHINDIKQLSDNKPASPPVVHSEWCLICKRISKDTCTEHQKIPLAKWNDKLSADLKCKKENLLLRLESQTENNRKLEQEAAMVESCLNEVVKNSKQNLSEIRNLRQSLLSRTSTVNDSWNKPELTAWYLNDEAKRLNELREKVFALEGNSSGSSFAWFNENKLYITTSDNTFCISKESKEYAS